MLNNDPTKIFWDIKHWHNGKAIFLKRLWSAYGSNSSRDLFFLYMDIDSEILRECSKSYSNFTISDFFYKNEITNNIFNLGDHPKHLNSREELIREFSRIDRLSDLLYQERYIRNKTSKLQDFLYKEKQENNTRLAKMAEAEKKYYPKASTNMYTASAVSGYSGTAATKSTLPTWDARTNNAFNAKAQYLGKVDRQSGDIHDCAGRWQGNIYH